MEHNEYFANLKKEYFPLTNGSRAYEYQRKVAEYVADNMLEDFSPVVIPHTNKPLALCQYERLGDLEKVSFNNKNPNWRAGVVQVWLDSVSSARQENESNTAWLKEWMDLLEDDTFRYHLLKDKLSEYDRVPQERKKESQNIMQIFSS